MPSLHDYGFLLFRKKIQSLYIYTTQIYGYIYLITEFTSEETPIGGTPTDY